MPYGINSCLLSTQADPWLGECGRACHSFLEVNTSTTPLGCTCSQGVTASTADVWWSSAPSIQKLSLSLLVIPETIPSTALCRCLVSRNPEFVPMQAPIQPLLPHPRYLFFFSTWGLSTERSPDTAYLNDNAFPHLLVETVLGGFDM